MVAAATLTRAAFAQARGAEATERARYEFLLTSLERERPKVKLWWTGWTLGYAGLTAGQGAAALFFPERGARIDAAVGAAESALGVIGMLITPHTVTGAPDELRAMDGSTPGARAARLRRAEALLEQSAGDEEDARSWAPHVEAALVNYAGSATLWFGYQRYAGGWLNLLAGTAIAELQIITRPTGASESWRRYRAGMLTAPAPTASWTVTPLLGGAALIGTF